MKNLSFTHPIGFYLNIWYNNGIEETYARERPGEDWVEGRKFCPLGAANPAFGRHWYNNGIEQRYEYECPIGFVPDRLYKKK